MCTPQYSAVLSLIPFGKSYKGAPIYLAGSIGETSMSLRDPMKIELARDHRIKKSVCRTCGATNPWNAIKCRKCHSKNLRAKRAKGKGR